MNIWNESLYAIYIVTESTIIYDQSVNFFLPMGDHGNFLTYLRDFFHAAVSNIPSNEQDWVVLVLVTLGFVLLVG